MGRMGLIRECRNGNAKDQWADCSQPFFQKNTLTSGALIRIILQEPLIAGPVRRRRSLSQGLVYLQAFWHIAAGKAFRVFGGKV